MATTRLRPDERGGALLAVLWLTAALAAIAFSLATTVRGEAQRASTAADGVRSYELATAAVRRAALHILWSVRFPGPASDYRLGVSLMRLAFPSGEVLVEIIPETAKLNINLSPPEELYAVLLHLGVEPGRAREIALAIVDWRTPHPEGPSGFDEYYLLRNPSFRARHASIEEIEELLLVKGMTPEIFYGTYERTAQKEGEGPRLVPRGGFRQCVSVYGTNQQVDANTAHPAVLAAIGLPPEAIAALVARRRAAPLRPEDVAALAQSDPAYGRLRAGGNSIFTLQATARLRLPDGKLSDMQRTVGAMVKFMPDGYGRPYHILRWYDRAWSN